MFHYSENITVFFALHSCLRLHRSFGAPPYILSLPSRADSLSLSPFVSVYHNMVPLFAAVQCQASDKAKFAMDLDNMTTDTLSQV